MKKEIDNVELTQYDQDISQIEKMLEGKSLDYVKGVFEQAISRFEKNYKLVKITSSTL